LCCPVTTVRKTNQWHPVAFFSKTMAPAECNYGIHDKEMLAIIRALQEYIADLEGLQREERFDIFTDHRVLEYFMTSKALNSRQANWSEYLFRFHFFDSLPARKEQHAGRRA
jgi:RNase H-like domain found in reverse transcriptase